MGGNPKAVEQLLLKEEEVKKLFKASKDVAFSIFSELMHIAEEHLTRREIEKLKRYVDTLQELTT